MLFKASLLHHLMRALKLFANAYFDFYECNPYSMFTFAGYNSVNLTCKPMKHSTISSFHIIRLFELNNENSGGLMNGGSGSGGSEILQQQQLKEIPEKILKASNVLKADKNCMLFLDCLLRTRRVSPRDHCQYDIETLSSLPYYMERLDVITSHDFCPSITDVMHCYMAAAENKVVQRNATKFTVNRQQFVVLDGFRKVPGEMLVTCVLCIISLPRYDSDIETVRYQLHQMFVTRAQSEYALHVIVPVRCDQFGTRFDNDDHNTDWTKESRDDLLLQHETQMKLKLTPYMPSVKLVTAPINALCQRDVANMFTHVRSALADRVVERVRQQWR